MTLEDLIVSMAGVKPLLLKQISESVGSSKDLLDMNIPQLIELGLSPARANKMLSLELKNRAIGECEFLYKRDVKALSVFDNEYSNNLRSCIDAPFLIYTMGDYDLNKSSDKFISFVGTRSSTTYGEQACSNLIQGIAKSHPDATIVSGLAFGIDSVAHREALRNGLKSIAVLPSGLDEIQPSSNTDLARNILSSGGLLISEYPSKTSVFKHNFLERNRIIAGLSVATVVAESPLRGGSIHTASFANDYDREVFAVPGRVTDKSFGGCNSLIKSSKAQLIDNISDLEYYLGWEKSNILMNLFAPDLNGVEKRVYECFNNQSELTDQEIIEQLDISAGEFFQAITALEIKELIKSVRGKMYIKI